MHAEKPIRANTLEGLRALIKHLEQFDRGVSTIGQLEEKAAKEHGVEVIMKGEKKDA